MRRLGATVALLVLAHLFRMPQTAADWSKDADTNAGLEQAGLKCLTVLNPPDGEPYELSEEEREEFHFLLNINCPGLPFGDKMSVKNGNEEFEVDLAEWHTEHYELTMHKANRGVSRWEFGLHRIGGGPVERAEATVTFYALLGPVVLVTFPPEGFTFYRGVNPFFRCGLEEQSDLVERFGPAREYSIHMLLESSAMRGDVRMDFGKVFLATIDDGTLPDGEYTMRLWVSDGNTKAYDPPILRKFFKDSTRDYPSIVTNADVTACQAVPVPCREGDCENGACVQGACLCEADWFGPRCEYDVLNAPSYLPREDPASSPLACHQAKHFRYGVSDLRALLRAQQQPSNPAMCTRVGLFHPDIVSAFGVNLRSLAIALGRSMQAGKPLGIAGNWSLIQHEDCPSGNLGCYFEPLTSCPTRDAPMEKWLHDGQELDYPRRSLHPLQLITEMQVCKPGAAECGIGQDSAVNVAEEIYAASGSVSWDWSDLGQHRPFLLFDFGNEDLINLGEAGQIIKASLKGAASWLIHPMAALHCLNLIRGHVEFSGDEEQLDLGDAYTLAIWVDFRHPDHIVRSAIRTTVGAPIAVQEGSRLLGLYDNGQLSRQSNKSDNATVSDPHTGFFGCGYAIQVTGWQLIMVVGSRGEGNASISRFFVNGEYVGTAERALFRSRLNMAGYRAQGPGFVAGVAGWHEALSHSRVQSFWKATRGRFGMHILDGSSRSSRARNYRGRTWTLAMTSTHPVFKGKGTYSSFGRITNRPNEKLRVLLRAAKRASGFRPGSVGIHIRRGDACDPVHARHCTSAEEVLVSVRKVLQRYNISSAYVATDDPSIIEELQILAQDVRWSFLENFNRTFLNQDSHYQVLLSRLGQLDRRVVAESAFIDLFLLAECSFLVLYIHWWCQSLRLRSLTRDPNFTGER